MQLTTLLLLSAPLIALAKTDLEGCTSSEVIVYGGASLLFYVPDTGEICSFLDCGGGRAPPKTTVPGCPLYVGTATVTPSFLSGFKAGATSSTTTGPTVTSTTGSSQDPKSTSSDSMGGTGPITAQPSETRPVATSLPASGNSTSSGLPSAASNQTTTSITSSVTGNGAAGISPGLLSPGSLGAVAAVLALMV